MPWEETNIMDLRLKFVVRSFEPHINFTQLCKEFGITTKTGYKWKNRFLEGGAPALADQSKKPLSNSKIIPTDTVCKIIKIKELKKNWGPRKIHAVLKDRYPEMEIPSISTVERILKKSGLVQKKRKKNFPATSRIKNRIKATAPNQIWTVDFKGWWYTPAREKCEPLTIRDEFSKFIISIKALEKGNIACVKAEFEKVFEKYGLPEIIRSDNGPPFASAQSLFGLTKLAAWWLSLGIQLDRIDPGSPYQNGAHERMHLDMMRELEKKIDGDLKLHQSVFEIWKKEFNTERPHEALGMKTPSSVYVKSKRRYMEIEEIAYPSGFRSRNVNDRGCITYRTKRIFISNAFAAFNVGLDVNAADDVPVWFAKNLIGHINSETLIFTPADKIITVDKIK
ncbi:MAG: integrase core domain-containing protein [Candidatus Heimdallarchaeota archaeon]|nr:integrase core domain-containing protein [Candidatus Heimdallarchaeota archaeon]